MSCYNPDRPATPGSGGCSRKGTGQGDPQQIVGPQADSHAQETRVSRQGVQGDTRAPLFLQYNGKSDLIYSEFTCNLTDLNSELRRWKTLAWAKSVPSALGGEEA